MSLKVVSAEALFQCYLCKFDENQRETKPMITSEPVGNKIAEKVERIKLKRSLALFPLFLSSQKKGGARGETPYKTISAISPAISSESVPKTLNCEFSL